MKVLLIRPMSIGDTYEAPIGLAYLGGMLEKHGYNVKIIDAEALFMPVKKVIEAIKEEKADIVGVSINSYYRFEGLKIVEAAKLNGAFTIVGGTHLNGTEKETLEDYWFIDAAFSGESEQTLLELVQAIEQKKPIQNIAGLFVRGEGNEIIRTGEREFIQDLNELKPAWHLLPMKLYRFYGVFGSRGCPWRCNFCASPTVWKRKLRLRDPKLVASEIKMLIDNYGMKDLHFKDDTFTADKAWAKAVADEVHQLGIKWECMGRVDTVDEEILQYLKDRGLQKIEFGIESGDQGILDRVQKDFTLAQAEKAIAAVRKVKLNYGAFFIVGHPGETRETAEKTFEFAYKLRSLPPAFSVLDILPGTQQYFMAKTSGVLKKDFRWSKKFLNSQRYPVPRYLEPQWTERDLDDLSKRFYIRYDLCLLFDLQNGAEWNYLMKDENVAWHFLPLRKQHVRFIADELAYAIKHSPNSKAKFNGFLRLPILMSRVGGNTGMRAIAFMKNRFKKKPTLGAETQSVDFSPKPTVLNQNLYNASETTN